MTFWWWTLAGAKWKECLKCSACWSNHLQMEVRLRRLCRSHLSRFKQNRSDVLCFFFLHNYPSGLCSLPKQHANERTSENIHEPGSEIRTRLHLPFQSSTPPQKKKAPFSFLPLQESFYNSFVTFCFLVHLWAWKLYSISSQKSFSLSTPSVWPRLHFSYFSFEFCLFSTSVSLFGPLFKNPACHQNPSACLPAPVEGQRQKNLSLFSSIMTGFQVCTSWMCVRRSSSWGQSLCVSGARSITSSIIKLPLIEAFMSASPETVLSHERFMTHGRTQS